MDTNTKAVVVELAKIYNGVVVAKANGTNYAADLPVLLDVIESMPDAVHDAPGVPAELATLSSADVDDISAAVMVACPSITTKVAAINRVRAVINLLLASRDTYQAFKNANGLDNSQGGAPQAPAAEAPKA